MNAQTQDLEQIAREALGFVSTSGIDRLGEENRKHLQYGLKQGLFKQEAVDAAQKRYEASSPNLKLQPTNIKLRF